MTQLVGDESRQGAVNRSPEGRRANARRLVKLLVVADLVIVCAAFALWNVLRDDPESNAANEGLRGSRPPAGQVWPALDDVAGITPALPSRADVSGRATMLVATCAACPSGDIIGGFLGRLGDGSLPDDARVVVLTWDGDQAAWARRWHVDSVPGIELHEATDPAAISTARRTLGIGRVDGAQESGIAFLHDRRGRWRSTFFVGQLQRDDVAHDLAELAKD
jgi:hypothetical protein